METLSLTWHLWNNLPCFKALSFYIIFWRYNLHRTICTHFKCTRTYSSIHFDKCVHPYNHHHNQDLEYFHHLKKFLPAPPPTPSLPLQPRPPLIDFLSLQLNLAFSSIPYKLHHKVCSVLFLTSFTWHKVFEIYQCCCI